MQTPEKRRKFDDAFSIQPLNRFQTKTPPPFGQPRQLACFSFDKDRKLHHDNSEMTYYHPMELGTSLDVGFETRIERENVPEHLDALIESMVVNDLPKNFNFVTWRGIITKLYTTPYDRRDGWILQAVRHGDTIYLEEVEGEEKKQREANMTERDLRMAYWGYSFENLSTYPIPPSEMQPTDFEALKHRQGNPVNTNIQYCTIYKTRVGQYSLLLGAEVDCCIDRGDSSQYLELKTSRVIENPRQEQTFEKKLLKFFAQSFLGGIPKIIVAFRTDDGTVNCIQPFKTTEIPRMVRGKVDWDPNVCLEFLHQVLKWIDSSLKKSDQVYTLTFLKNSTEISIKEEGTPFLPDILF